MRTQQRLTQRIHKLAQSEVKTKFAITLLIHRVEVLKPQSNCRERVSTNYGPPGGSGVLSDMAIFQQPARWRLKSGANFIAIMKIAIKLRAVYWYSGPLPVLLMLLFTLSWSTALHAQTIRIKLVDGRSGRPLVGAYVNVWVGKERKAALAIPTDNDGVARLRLTEKDREIDTNNSEKRCGNFGVINPVVKYDDSLRINAGYVWCQPHTPSYSWLLIADFPTKQVVQQGIVTPNICGIATASPEPGEVVIFVRPLTWWEKLKS